MAESPKWCPRDCAGRRRDPRAAANCGTVPGSVQVGPRECKRRPSPPSAIAEEFGEAAADPARRTEYLAAAEFKVTSLPETERLLGSTAGLRVEDRRVVVPAAAAFNATLVFTE